MRILHSLDISGEHQVFEVLAHEASMDVPDFSASIELAHEVVNGSGWHTIREEQPR